PVTNWILDLNLIQYSAVLESNCDGIADRSLLGVVVISCIPRLFHTFNLLAEGVNARISRDGIGVVGGRETAKDEGNGNHVLNAVIAISIVVERTLLVNNTDGSFLSPDLYVGNVV